VGAVTINNNSADGTVDFTQGLVFTDNTNNQGAWTHAGIVSVGGSGYNGNLVFGTDGDSTRNTSGITEKMRIDSSGNVIMQPAKKLYLDGGTHTYIEEVASDQLRLVSGGTEVLKAYPGGTIDMYGSNIDRNIEIGANRTGNANSYIDLIGDTTYTDYGLRLIRWGYQGANAQSAMYHRGTGDMLYINQEAAPHIWYVGGGEKMRIDNAGNVGIGVIPKTGGPTWQHIQFGGTGNLIARKSDTTIDSMFANNYYVNSSNVDSYITTGAAARMFFNDNVITFDQAASGSTDAALSFSTALKIDALGDVKITESLGIGVNASSTTGRLDCSNDVVAYSTSDKRLKENIKPLDSALDKVLQISGVEFDWKELTEEEKKTIHGNQGHDVGVIAQEIEEVLPEVVTTRDSGYKAVKYEKIVPLLIEAIKEQQKEIEELKNG
jgi:hypothetical protein